MYQSFSQEEYDQPLPPTSERMAVVAYACLPISLPEARFLVDCAEVYVSDDNLLRFLGTGEEIGPMEFSVESSLVYAFEMLLTLETLCNETSGIYWQKWLGEAEALLGLLDREVL